MSYWLMKSEPEEFGLCDLRDSPSSTACWDGVRNYQARNMMRDDMRKGDLAFFYHSNCPEPAIVGIMEVVRCGYPDHTAFDSNNHLTERMGSEGSCFTRVKRSSCAAATIRPLHINVAEAS